MSLTSSSSSTISADNASSDEHQHDHVTAMSHNHHARPPTVARSEAQKSDTNNQHHHQQQKQQQQQPAKTADLFGIQMEVTNLLLEMERRRLRALQRELETTSPMWSNDTCGKKELEQQQLYIRRMEEQYGS
ncbi:hypothetical protein BV898_10455 [Hypsibius exemplaris]|uniref:Uncharacterized protein n=1 Tax=Hypsibius exemplaris TaxID=2072580 RepID=A0A1W0WJJ6_HYPEX|nr:hypothetical protein BV898_10455 [Hypsibius exemplaris]